MYRGCCLVTRVLSGVQGCVVRCTGGVLSGVQGVLSGVQGVLSGVQRVFSGVQGVLSGVQGCCPEYRGVGGRLALSLRPRGLGEEVVDTDC